MAHRVNGFLTDWLRQQPQLSQRCPLAILALVRGLRLPLMAAAHRPATHWRSSRGGRPDLAANQLTQVRRQRYSLWAAIPCNRDEPVALDRAQRKS
ncbi:MAG: hypothetical protein R2932_30785 [Caldilineaceae bacterium]